MLLVMWAVAPVGWCVTAAVRVANDLCAPANWSSGTPQRSPMIIDGVRRPRSLLPAEARNPRVHRTAYRAQYHRVQPSPSRAGFVPRDGVKSVSDDDPGVARRDGDRRREPAAPAGAGGTPTPTPTRPSTATSSATSTSSGARRACARPTPACSARSPGGGSSRSAAAPRPARAGWPRRVPRWSRPTCPPACCGTRDARTQHPGYACRWSRPTRWRCRSGTAIVRHRVHRLRRGARSSPTRRHVMREVFRVLRPGGRWVFSVTHPMRWIFLDDPGEGGLVAVHSYFDRRPYVETTTAAGRRPTSSSTAPSATGSANWSRPASS